jgi:hypothetical protein
MTGIGALLPPPGQATFDGICPFCMDRLLFATEGMLSEVAHMYPAYRSARGPWPSWEYARTIDLITGQADEQPKGAPDFGCAIDPFQCSSSIANSVEAVACFVPIARPSKTRSSGSPNGRWVTRDILKRPETGRGLKAHRG